MIMIDTLARIGVGVAIYIVMFLLIALTTRDTTIYDDCGEKEKSPNCVRMFMRGITFLMIEADAYLIIIRDFPILKTIGISIFSYPVALIIALLVLLIRSVTNCIRKLVCETISKVYYKENFDRSACTIYISAPDDAIIEGVEDEEYYEYIINNIL